jgi:hypothetical protein
MDTNLHLRVGSTAGNLTGDETLTDMELTPMNKPLYLHIDIPAVSTDDVMDITADFENVSNTTLQQTTIPQITAAGKYVIPLFCDHPDLTDLSVILNVTATGTAAMNFGAVDVWISTSRKS